MVLLIGGHQRSGTTLLYNICDRHPDISLTLEFGNFLNFWFSYRVYGRKILERWWKLRYRPINSSCGRGRWTLIRNLAYVTRYMLSIYRFRQERPCVPVIEAALRSMTPNARIVGDKYPDYVFLLNRLTQEDDISLLIIYRDCRDVVSSTLNKARTEWRNRPFVKKADSAEKIATRWVRAIDLMERHSAKIHSIRYEDLVQDPGTCLRALGLWAGVDPGGFPEDIISRIHIGKYKNALSMHELDTIMNIAGPTMARFGYI